MPCAWLTVSCASSDCDRRQDLWREGGGFRVQVHWGVGHKVRCVQPWGLGGRREGGPAPPPTSASAWRATAAPSACCIGTCCGPVWRSTAAASGLCLLGSVAQHTHTPRAPQHAHDVHLTLRPSLAHEATLCTCLLPARTPARGPRPAAGYTSLITQDALNKARAGQLPLPPWEEFRQQLAEGTAKFPSRKHPFLFAGEGGWRWERPLAAATGSWRFAQHGRLCCVRRAWVLARPEFGTGNACSWKRRHFAHLYV